MVYYATVIYFCSIEKNCISLQSGSRNKTETPHDSLDVFQSILETTSINEENNPLI